MPSFSKFFFKELPNKVNIPAYLLSLPHFNSLSGGVVVKVGTVDEIWPQEAGLAHALEHLVLRGTKKFPSAQLLSGYLEEVGGFKEGLTDQEKTLYYGQVPYQYAERLIEVLAEIVNFYLLPEEAITKEIQVIQEEIKRKQDDPLKFLTLKARNFIFGSHPLGREVLGDGKSLEKLTRSDFLNFASKYYYPANFAILLVGNLQTKKAIKFIERYFIKGEKEKPHSRLLLPLKKKKERELKFFHPGKQAYLELIAPLDAPQDKSTQALKIFAEMIGGGVASPLFQEIREKRGLAYQLSTSVLENSLSLFQIALGTKPEAYQEVISLIFKIIKESKNNAQLLAQAKRKIKGRLLLLLDNPLFLLKRSANELVYYGRPRNFQEILQDLEVITIKDIKRAVEAYLMPDNFYRIIMLPQS